MNDAAAVPLFARLTLVGLVWFGWTARIFKTTMAILGRRRLRRRRCFDPVVVGWTLSSFPPPSPPRTSMRPSCYRAHGRGINLQLAILTTSVIVVSSNFVWRREGSTRAQNTRMWWWVGQNGDRHSIGLVRSYYSVSVCQTIVIEACKWRRTFLLFFFFHRAALASNVAHVQAPPCWQASSKLWRPGSCVPQHEQDEIGGSRCDVNAPVNPVTASSWRHCSITTSRTIHHPCYI
jgi:hypothetical protein